MKGLLIYLVIWVVSLTWCLVQPYEPQYQGNKEAGELQDETLWASLAIREEMLEQEQGLTWCPGLWNSKWREEDAGRRRGTRTFLLNHQMACKKRGRTVAGGARH